MPSLNKLKLLLNESHGHIMGGEKALQFTKTLHRIVKYRCRKRGIGMALDEYVDEIGWPIGAPGSDDWNADQRRDGAGKRNIEAAAGAVTVHRRQQNLP